MPTAQQKHSIHKGPDKNTEGVKARFSLHPRYLGETQTLRENTEIFMMHYHNKIKSADSDSIWHQFKVQRQLWL